MFKITSLTLGSVPVIFSIAKKRLSLKVNMTK